MEFWRDKHTLESKISMMEEANTAPIRSRVNDKPDYLKIVKLEHYYVFDEVRVILGTAGLRFRATSPGSSEHILYVYTMQ
jgi:hypothetical protein